MPTKTTKPKAAKASKKIHPADQIDTAALAAATEFTATILVAGKQQQETFTSLAGARGKAIEMEKAAANGKRALIHAIVKGRAILVPHEFGRGVAPKAGAAPASVDIKDLAKSGHPIAEANKASWNAVTNGKGNAAKAAVTTPAKAAKPDAAAKKAAPKKAGGQSKTDKAVAMLTRKGGATRAEIAEATEWPSIDIKALAKRRGIKLKVSAEGVITGTAAAA